MSEKALNEVLKKLGLTETESEVYLFLARQGALKGTEISKLLRKDKAQIYHILKNLQAKGLTETTLEAPVRFVPVPFENVIDSAIKAKMDEANQIERTKIELLDYWKHTNKTKLELSADRFVVIQGRQKVYSKINQMISATEKHLSLISTVPSWLSGDQIRFYESAASNHLKSKICFRFLTKLSEQNISKVSTVLKKLSYNKFNFSVRSPDLKANLPREWW